MHTTKVSDTHDPAACDLEIYDQPPTQCEDLRPKGGRESTEAGSREVEVQEAGSGEADVQDQVRRVRDPKLIFDMYKVQHVLSRNGIKNLLRKLVHIYLLARAVGLGNRDGSIRSGVSPRRFTTPCLQVARAGFKTLASRAACAHGERLKQACTHM